MKIKDYFLPDYYQLAEDWKNFSKNFSKDELEELLTLVEVKWPPQYITLEIITKCNLNCPFCYNHSGEKISIYPEKIVDKNEIFEFFNKQNVKFGKVSLSGCGEPFLHKDIFSILDFLKKWTDIIIIGSNLQILNKKKIEMLKDYNLLWNISCDGGDKITYEKYRRNGNFEKFLDNLKILNKYFYNKITLVSIVFKENMNSILKLPEFLSSNNFNNIPICIVKLVKHPKLKELNELSETEKRDFLKKLKEKCKIYNINLLVSGNFVNKEPSLEHDYYSICHEPFEYMQISFTGNVNFCCGGMRMIEGDAFSEKASLYFNNEIVKKLRLLLIAGYPPSFCRNLCNKKLNPIFNIKEIKERIEIIKDYPSDIARFIIENKEFIKKAKKVLESNCKIAIYGAGEFFKMCKKILHINKDNVKIIFDDFAKINEIDGIPVKNNIEKNDYEVFIIMTYYNIQKIRNKIRKIFPQIKILHR